MGRMSNKARVAAGFSQFRNLAASISGNLLPSPPNFRHSTCISTFNFFLFPTSLFQSHFPFLMRNFCVRPPHRKDRLVGSLAGSPVGSHVGACDDVMLTLLHSRNYSYRSTHHHFDDFFSFFFRDHFDDFDPQLFLKYVRHRSKLGFTNIDYPLSLFHHMKSIRPLPSIVDFYILFTAMTKMKPNPPLSTVISLSRQLQLLGLHPDDYSLTILANCYCRLGNVDLGFSILASIIKLGYQPNIVTFTTLINGFIHTDQFNQAVRLLDKIVKLGYQPTLVTYGSMFRGLCRLGDNYGALNLLRNMESHRHCTPNVVIYSTIIDSLCKDQLLPLALHLFKEMKSKRISPNVVTYSTLIRGMCTLGQWKEARDMYNEMLGNNIQPTIKTCNMLIDRYCKEGRVGEARAIYESITKRGLLPNIVTYSALLDGYCLRGEMDEAEKLMDLMIKHGCEPNVVTYSSLINGYCKSKKIDRALGLLKKMPLVGLSPNVVTYSTLIDGLCKDNQLEFARQLFKDMKSHGLKPVIVTYNSLLDGLCKNAWIDEAMQLFKEMKNNGVHPNIILYNILIDGLFEAGQLGEAVDIFSVLIGKGRHNVRSYNRMIKRFCKKGLLTDADELLKKMEDNGCSPDNCTFNTIIRGFLYGKNVKRALELISIMRSRGFAVDNHNTSSLVVLLADPTVGDSDKELVRNFFENRLSDNLEEITYDQVRKVLKTDMPTVGYESISHTTRCSSSSHIGCNPLLL
ncbi:putative pentatricopeptide repeat-containing protein At1g12700, mitochondrial [Spinacia oleracea]|uniref:Pentatricopeptide repeat-containing protein At1g12700, mitochondrial n=1 Tax=Spinacia oleracea TaxID=3562 RepID=A0ABM3RP68_SPIOL|nr:putative pentatricopeptide repeat-containing protein At1g12700, mitochondrial [Spinacia oleracea]